MIVHGSSSQDRRQVMYPEIWQELAGAANLPMTPILDLARSRRALLVYFAVFTAFTVAALRLQVAEAPLPFLASAWVGACAGILVVYWWSMLPDDTWTLWKLVAGGMVADILFKYVALTVEEGIYKSGWSTDFLWLRAALLGVGNVGLLAVGIGAGLLVVRGMKKPSYLVMAAIVCAVTDIVSVYKGPSAGTRTSDFFPFVAYHWGLIGQGDVVPCVGLGDFIFLALFFAGVRRFGMNDRKTFVAMCAAFAVGLLALLVLPAVPALPFMSLALLLVHARELRLLLKQDSAASQGGEVELGYRG